MKSFILLAFAMGLIALALITRPLWWRTATGAEAPNPRPGKGLAIALTAFVLIVAAGGYALVGAPAALHLGPESSAPPKKPSAEQIAAVGEMLEERVKAEPDDPVAWTLLGRTYTAQGKHQQAVQALRKAVAIKADDPLVLADLAVALASVDRSNLQGESRQLAERALALDPRNAKALSIAGTAAFDRRDYAQAVKFWDAVVQTQPPGSPVAVQAQAALAEARRMAGQ